MSGKNLFKIVTVLAIALTCLSINGCKKQKPAAEYPVSTEEASKPSEQPKAESGMTSEQNKPAEPNMSGMFTEPNKPTEPNMSGEPNKPGDLNEPNEPNQPSPEEPM